MEEMWPMKVRVKPLKKMERKNLQGRAAPNRPGKAY